MLPSAPSLHFSRSLLFPFSCWPLEAHIYLWNKIKMTAVRATWENCFLPLRLFRSGFPLSLSERRSSACSCRVRSHSFSRIFSPLSLLIGAEFLAPSNSSNAASGKHLPFSAINNITALSPLHPPFLRRAGNKNGSRTTKNLHFLYSFGSAVNWSINFLLINLKLNEKGYAPRFNLGDW